MKLKKFTTNFIVENINQSIIFYQDVLGFQVEMIVDRNQNTDNQINESKDYVFAIMSKDNIVLMFQTPESMAEDVPVFKDITPGTSACYYLEVEGLKEFYQEIKTKVEVVKDLYTTWYGMEEFHIKDCNGNIIGFGERTEEA
ncbi:VOC family protein [Cytobacillus sp. IB215665]|uniref:VOC family protein n=1 Tax=Cytobacillus sp. IB215665 TaxID=3097357 RepID=UPI002A0C248A|nr:VOC family protein [Cytobacillus sp. IB215665]MDX8367095.1 VOC family protein [Cytobacillus sp. IB215665]